LNPFFFSKGKLIEKVLASCAIPGGYPAKKIGGIRYIEAGISGTVGIKKAEELGCERIILLDLSPNFLFNKKGFIKRLFGFVDSTFLGILKQEIKSVKKSRILEIRIRKKYSGKFDDFQIIESLLKQGERDAKKVLDKKGIFSKKDFLRKV
jgi:predicted patatin/cPLA2 family phospholipase